MKQKSIGIAICLIVLLFAGLKLAGVAFGDDSVITIHRDNSGLYSPKEGIDISDCAELYHEKTNVLIGYNCNGELYSIINAAEGHPVTQPSGENCVPLKDIISSWESALLSKYRPNLSMATYTICATCDCWHDIGSAEYYECLANNKREKERLHKEDNNLLERAKKYGVCK